MIVLSISYFKIRKFLNFRAFRDENELKLSRLEDEVKENRIPTWGRASINGHKVEQSSSLRERA